MRTRVCETDRIEGRLITPPDLMVYGYVNVNAMKTLRNVKLVFLFGAGIKCGVVLVLGGTSCECSCCFTVYDL